MRDAAPILVVDDCFEDFATIADAAAASGLPNPLIHAKDAAEAEAKLAGKSNSESPAPFSLIILDYNLPGNSGLELLQDYSKSPDRHSTPVVFLTTSASLKDCRECYSAGANAYHTKSLHYNECVATVQGIFRYWLNLAMLPSAAVHE